MYISIYILIMSAYNSSLSFSDQQQVYDSYFSAAFEKTNYHEYNRNINRAQARSVDQFYSSFGTTSGSSKSTSKSSSSLSTPSYWSSSGIF